MPGARRGRGSALVAAFVSEAAATAAPPSSPAEAKRASGSFAMARPTSADRAGHTAGTSSDAAGGGSDKCAQSFASSLSRGNGTSPVRHW